MTKLFKRAVFSIGSLGSFVGGPTIYAIPAQPADAWHRDWNRIGIDMHRAVMRAERDLGAAPARQPEAA